jgi:hypothetical protein
VSLTLLARRDCELCEEMHAAIVRLARTLPLPALEVLDVDADQQLRRRHGLDVPVLLLGGTVVCRHRLDENELKRLLRHFPVA